MAPQRLAAGIWADVETGIVDLCPACILQMLGQPVNLENVTAALLVAVVFCKIVHNLEVQIDIPTTARRYLEEPTHEQIHRNGH